MWGLSATLLFIIPKLQYRHFSFWVTQRDWWKLDYCNALLLGLPKNTANKTATINSDRKQMTPVFKVIPWLPVSFSIHFNIFFKHLMILRQSNTLTRFQCVNHFFLSSLLVVPNSRIKTLHESAFSSWAVLIKMREAVLFLNANLKTYLYSLAFDWNILQPSCIQFICSFFCIPTEVFSYSLMLNLAQCFISYTLLSIWIHLQVSIHYI